jgi:hypothetical protein
LAAAQDEVRTYQTERCTLLAEALQTAAKNVGEPFLSRLLYEVIAPMTTMTFDASSDDDYKLLTEGLCQ